jgi:hypothetical protein
MSVLTYNVHVYRCTCDVCGARQDVLQDDDKGIYNGAQAVRSIGWSFGKNSIVRCKDCRRLDMTDHYKDIK